MPSLRSLVRSLASDSGLEVLLEVSGRAGRMPAPIEHAVFRVAHEALYGLAAARFGLRVNGLCDRLRTMRTTGPHAGSGLCCSGSRLRARRK